MMFDFEEFKAELRLSRDKLEGVERELSEVYFKGVPGLINLLLKYKKLGVKKTALLAMEPKQTQYSFLAWMEDSKFHRNKDEIDSWFSRFVEGYRNQNDVKDDNLFKG